MPQSNRIDLLITDVVMPRMDGPTLIKRRARQAARHEGDLHLRLCRGQRSATASTPTNDIHFLPKPFSLKQLAGKVKEVLRDG